MTGDLPSPVPGLEAYQHPVARSVESCYSEEAVADSPESEMGEENTAAEVEPRILVVHDSASTYRLIEETFGNFTAAKVDSTSDILTAFELSILRDYQLFIVAFKLPEMSGSIFYELVSRAYKSGLGNRKLAPAIVFVREPEDPLPSEEILTDVRVKAVWSKPLSIERMLESVSSVIKPVEGGNSRQPA